MELAVGEDDVDGGAQALDDLHLEHGALQLVVQDELRLHHALRELHDQPQEVRDTLARDGRARDQGHVFAHVRVLVVQRRVQANLAGKFYGKESGEEETYNGENVPVMVSLTR